MPHLLVLAAYLAIAVVSSVFYDFKYRDYAQDRLRQKASVASFRLANRWIQVSTILLLILSLGWQVPWLFPLWNNLIMLYAGLAMALSGLGVFVAARLSLGQNYSPCFDAYLPKTLVVKGIYAWIRHPIYTANMLIVGGAALSTGNLILMVNVLLLCSYYHRSTKLEEAELHRAHPQYGAYQQSAGRFFPKLSRLARMTQATDLATTTDV